MQVNYLPLFKKKICTFDTCPNKHSQVGGELTGPDSNIDSIKDTKNEDLRSLPTVCSVECSSWSKRVFKLSETYFYRALSLCIVIRIYWSEDKCSSLHRIYDFIPRWQKRVDMNHPRVVSFENGLSHAFFPEALIKEKLALDCLKLRAE